MSLPNNSTGGSGEETAGEFSSRLAGLIRGGLSCLGVAMGMQTGLFEVLISLGGEPKTSQEIADAANFKERYVREWLGCMVMSDIVNYDHVQETYRLPENRSGILQSATMALAIPCLSEGFFEVAECFKRAGPAGVEYERYSKLDGVLDRLHEPFFRDQLIQEFLPSMPKLMHQLRQGIQMLDVGCCGGNSLRMVATRFPDSHFYGLDVSPTVIERARDETRQAGLTNADFICGDVVSMPVSWTHKFDYIFVYFVLHDLSYPEAGLREMHRVLKPGGTMSVVDTASHTRLRDNLKKVDRDYAIAQFTMSLMNCLPVSLRPGNGAGLGAMWGREKAREMIEEASFEVLSISPTNAFLNGLHYLCKKPLKERSNNINNTSLCCNGLA